MLICCDACGFLLQLSVLVWVGWCMWISNTTVPQKWCFTLSFLSERSFAPPNRRHSLEHPEFKPSGDSTRYSGKPPCLTPDRALKSLSFVTSAAYFGLENWPQHSHFKYSFANVPESLLTVVSSRGPRNLKPSAVVKWSLNCQTPHVVEKVSVAHTCLRLIKLWVPTEFFLSYPEIAFFFFLKN